MSAVTHTLTVMTQDSSASDQLYYAIESLRGWEPILSLHKSRGRDEAWRVGTLISTLLVAGGESRTPIAVSGRATDEGTGEIVVLYPDSLVIADVTNLGIKTGDVIVTVLPMDGVTKLRVSTRHNYFSGTERSKRTDGIEVSFVLGEREITLQPALLGMRSSFTDDAAIARAFEVLRGAVIGASRERVE